MTNQTNPRPKLVVSVLLKNKNKFLLVKETLESGVSKWIIPGGKVEFGESLEEAAKRELEEEVGIKVKRLKLLSHKEAIFPKHNYHTVIFFFEAKTNKTVLGKDIEGKVEDARWFTKKETKAITLVESAEWLLNKFL